MIDETRGVDAVIPRWETGYIEPLHAVYKIQALKKLIPVFTGNSNISLNLFIKKMKIKFVSTNILKHLDPQLLTFYNINTLKDIEKARKILLSSVTIS